MEFFGGEYETESDEDAPIGSVTPTPTPPAPAAPTPAGAAATAAAQRPQWRVASSVDYDAAIARARADLPLKAVLEALNLEGYALLCAEVGIDDLRALGRNGAPDVAAQLLALGFLDDDIAKIVRVACSPLLQADVHGVRSPPPTPSRAVAAWDRAQCLAWLGELRDDAADSAVDVDVASLLRTLAADDGDAPLTGATLIAAARSTRELRDSLGLRSMEQRRRFEAALRRVGGIEDDGTSLESLPTRGGISCSFEADAMTRGGIYSAAFLRAAAPLYNLHMGAENMGPMLYALVRFTKRVLVLEIGAGYTSLFLLQALHDNARELDAFARNHAAGRCVVPSAEPGAPDMPWCVDAVLDAWREGGARVGGQSSDDAGSRSSSSGSFAASASAESGNATGARGVLHCVDNMAHAHTTAPQVLSAARSLGLEAHLTLHVADAWTLAEDFAPCVSLDMLWVDFGAGARLDEFLSMWWPRLSGEGGLLIIHSTLTNQLTREWLEKMRALQVEGGLHGKGAFGTYASFRELSFREPHKMFQNSFSIFQKRDPGWAEPVYTRYP